MMKKDFLPDISISIFVFLLLFITLFSWQESKRPFLEFVIALLFGFIVAGIGIFIDRYVNFKHQKEKTASVKHRKQLPTVQMAVILFMMLGFATAFVQVYVKYWIFSFLIGFIGLLDITLLWKEYIWKKRYQWEDFK